MRAGRLRHQVTIQSLVKTRDSKGGVTETWSNFAKNIWAAVEPLRGRELFSAQQINSEITTRIRIRYLAGVLPTMRVLFGTRTYNISGPINPAERNRELEMMCVDGVTDG